MNIYKTALFLGAGFSCEADMPIMSGFGAYSENQILGKGNFSGLIKNKDKLAYGLLKERGEIYEAFRKKYKKTKLGGGFDANNLEDVFTLAELLLECDQRKIDIDIEDIENKNTFHKDIDIEELIDSIHIWLWQLFRRIPLHNIKKWGISPETETAYKNFILHVNHYGTEYGFQNINLITTNYDMLIEYLCNAQNLKIAYPIEKKFFEFEPSICESPKPATGDFAIPFEQYNTPNYLAIAKLHGSVNFFEKRIGNDNKVRIISETGGKTGNSSIKNNLPTISALDAIYELYSNRKLLPSLIPPTYAKLKKYAWLRSIWSHTLNALSNCRKWIFIGYSFPPTDGHLKTLINLALMQSEHWPEVVVVSPSSNIIYNYREIIGDRFTLYQKPFSAFINNGDFEKEITK